MQIARARQTKLTGLATRAALARHQRGAVAFMAAMTLLLTCAFLALSIDTGRLWLERRALQRTADMAAMAAVRYTGCGGSPGKVTTAATDMARTNGLDSALDEGSATINATYGTLGVDGQKATVFIPSSDPSSTLGSHAVKVNLSRQVPTSIVLGGMFTTPLTITAAATARGGPPIATYSQDSSVVSIDAFDTLWAKVIGSKQEKVSASQLDLLAASTISVKDLMTAAKVSTVEELLNSTMTVSELISKYSTAYSAAAAANDQVDPGVATALSALASAAGANGTNLQLKDILSLNTGTKDAVLDANLNILSLVNTSFRVLGKQTHVFDISISAVDTVGVNLKAMAIAPIAIGPGGTRSNSPLRDANKNIQQSEWCTYAQSSNTTLTVYVSPTSSKVLGPILKFLEFITFGLVGVDLDLALQLQFGNGGTALDAIEPNAGVATTHFQTDTSAIAVKYTNKNEDGDGKIVIKLLIPIGIGIGNYDKLPQFQPVTIAVNTPIHYKGNLPKSENGSSEVAGTVSAILKSAPPKLYFIFGNSKFDLTKLVDIITTGLSDILSPIFSATIDPLLRALGINIGASKITLYDIQRVEPVLVQ
jgi:uncharacterized membrane protein